MAEDNDSSSENIDLEKFADELGDLIDEEFIGKLKNLKNFKIKGKDNNEKLNNFKSETNNIIETAKKIESKFIEFNKIIEPKDEVSKKINAKIVEGLDGTLMLDLEKLKNDLKTHFKDDSELFFYLFDQLEDVLKTPVRTAAFLKGLENEAKTMTKKEVANQNKELDELKSNFDKLINYFRRNFDKLKTQDLNEGIVREYLTEAFDGLEKIDNVNDIQNTFENEIKTFDSLCTQLFDKLLVSKNEKDAPIYKNAMQFVRNVMHVYDLIASEYKKEAVENIGGMQVFNGVNVISVVGNPEADTDEGLNGEWAKRYDDLLKLWNNPEEIIITSNNEINYFVSKTELIKEVITQFLQFSEKLTEKNGIKESLTKFVKEEMKDEEEDLFGDLLEEIENEGKEVLNDELKEELFHPKKIIRELNAKSKEIKKINKLKEEKENERIEELQGLSSELQKYKSSMIRINEFMTLLINNIKVSDKEKVKVELLNIYSKMTNEYLKAEGFLEKIQKKIIPMVDFIIKNHDNLVFYYGNPSNEKNKINENKQKLKKSLDEIKKVLNEINSYKTKISIKEINTKMLELGVIKKQVRKQYEEKIKPNLEKINKDINEMKNYLGGLK